MVKLTDAIKSNGINPTSNGSFKYIIDNCKNTNRSGDRTKLSWWENYSYSLKLISDSSISCRGDQKTLNTEYHYPVETSLLKPTVKWTAASGNPNGAVISGTTITFEQNDTSSNKVYNFNGTCTENTINLTTTAKITQIANKNKFKFVFKNTSGYTLQLALMPSLAIGRNLQPTISFAGMSSYGGYGKVTNNNDTKSLTSGTSSIWTTRDFFSYHTSNDCYGQEMVIKDLPIVVSGVSQIDIPVEVEAIVEIKNINTNSVVQTIKYDLVNNGFAGNSYATPLKAQFDTSDLSTFRVHLPYNSKNISNTSYLSDANSLLYYADTTIYISFLYAGSGGTTPPVNPDIPPTPDEDYYY